MAVTAHVGRRTRLSQRQGMISETMAAEPPTVAELRKAAKVSDQEVDAAVQAYLRDPRSSPFQFAFGHEIDVADAIETLQPAKAMLVAAIASSEFKRDLIRIAILLAHPVEG